MSINLRNIAFFLIFSMVSGLRDPLQIFCHLHLIELLGFLIGLGLLKLDMSKHSAGFDMLVFVSNSNRMEFQVGYLPLFHFFSVIDSIVILDGKSLEEYPVTAGISQGSIIGSSLFLLHINNLPDDVICNIVISMLMILLCTSSVIRHLISSINQTQDIIDLGKKWLVDFIAGKTQQEKCFKMLRLSFPSELDWSPYIAYILKLFSRKLEP